MLMTGIMGAYVGRIYAEVKRRPLYVVDRTIGFAASAPPLRERESSPSDARGPGR
jgi:dolichol-phosphate mannosyltransferase